MIYLDTSLLVALLLNEDASERVEAWLAEKTVDTLAVSGWVEVEIAGAFARLARTGAISIAQRNAAMAAYHRLRDTSLTLLDIPSRIYAIAADRLLASERALKSGDALHLAIVIEGGHRLATLDTLLHNVAAETGVVVERVV